MSVLKDHKDFLLPVLGIVVVMVIIGLSLGEENMLGVGLTDWGESQTQDGQSNKDRKYSSVPEMNIDINTDYSAVIKTSKGEIEVDLLESQAPKTVNNFIFLAEEDYYDNLTFHRVISSPYPFMIQGGDPKGDGTGGPGYTFEDEINAVSLGLDRISVRDVDYLAGLYNQADLNLYANRSLMDLYTDIDGYEYNNFLQSTGFSDGVLAMANSGPNSNGSQFFITMTGSSKYTQHLNGKHTVFGRVVSGMNVVDEIARVEVDGSNKPLNKVTIDNILITGR